MSGHGPPALFVAIRDFGAGSALVKAGDTIVAGHPILRGHEADVRPLEPTHELPPSARPARAGAERTVRPPGEVRG